MEFFIFIFVQNEVGVEYKRRQLLFLPRVSKISGLVLIHGLHKKPNKGNAERVAELSPRVENG